MEKNPKWTDSCLFTSVIHGLSVSMVTLFSLDKGFPIWQF